MPTANNKASSPRRWLDSQTGIPGSTANSIADDWFYTGQRLTPTDKPTRPLTFNGFRCDGKLLRKAVPGHGPGHYIPTGTDGSAPYHNPLRAGPLPTQMILAQNKAYDRLLEKVKSDTSSLAVTAAEGKEAFEMVAKRVTGLYRSYKHLRQGKFRQALNELRVEPKRKHRNLVRSASHEASGLWLEYWFGWSPTVQDIGSAAMALSVNPVLTSTVERASAGFVLPPRTVTVGGVTGPSRIVTQGGKGVVRHGARFTLSNENLFLANRLGLINPMLVAWEVVPFSFVVDWFTKFGGYLESFTDLAGLSVTEAWSVQHARLTQHGSYYASRRSAPENRCDVQWNQYYTRRGTSLYKPVPVIPRLVNFGNSKTRAATAVSLLTALFIQK